MVTLSPAIGVAATAGVATVAFALGPVAVVAVGVIATGLFAAKSALARWARKQQIAQAYALPVDERLQEAQSDVERLANQMNVDGEVKVVFKEGQVHPSASALAGKGGRHVIFVNEALLRLPPEQVRAVMAHEVAHLQQNGRMASIRNFIRGSAMPVGMAAGAAVGASAGLGAASGGVAALAWVAVIAASAAVSRIEERRADREAYQVSGEHLSDALVNIHDSVHNSSRPDLPWRVEDLLATHGNLPNRLSDMRESIKA